MTSFYKERYQVMKSGFFTTMLSEKSGGRNDPKKVVPRIWWDWNGTGNWGLFQQNQTLGSDKSSWTHLTGERMDRIFCLRFSLQTQEIKN